MDTTKDDENPLDSPKVQPASTTPSRNKEGINESNQEKTTEVHGSLLKETSTRKPKRNWDNRRKEGQRTAETYLFTNDYQEQQHAVQPNTTHPDD